MNTLPIQIALVLLTAVPALAQATRAPWQREPEEIRRTLDSLAAISVGPYVHFVVGSCAGGRCEERVSIYRSDAEVPYFYRAGAWVGLPAKPRFYVVNRELEEAEAGSVLADARLGGVLALVSDSGAGDRRQPRFWLRARFGDHAISVDATSLGSPTYAASVEGGPGALYDRVEKALVGLLRKQFSERE